MTHQRWRRLPEILTTLEDLELPLLSWGVTDASLNTDEVRAILADAVTADLDARVTDVPSEDEYLSELRTRALLHHVPGTSPARYRTRLAEGLRLLSNLRQLFPPGPNASQQWWRAGLPLVADYRLHVAPRRYPRRDIPQTLLSHSWQVATGGRRCTRKSRATWSPVGSSRRSRWPRRKRYSPPPPTPAAAA